MNIFQKFLIFSIYFHIIQCESDLTWKGRYFTCQEYIAFKNCKNGEKRIFRNQNLKIIADFKRCQKSYIFDFNLVEINTGKSRQFPKNAAGPILFVNKFTLDQGTYRVVLNVYTKKNEISIFKDDCILKVEVSPPIPMIQGGFQRYIGAGLDLIFNASGSIDYNFEYPLYVKHFEYSWAFDCDDCGGLQAVEEKGHYFILQGHSHKKEQKYRIRLGVRTKWWKDIVYTQQFVYLRTRIPGVEIACEDICSPPFRDGDMTLLGHCTSNCPKDIIWSWNVYEVPKDDNDVISGSQDWILKFSKTGSKNSIQLLEKDFEHDKSFLVTVTIDSFKNTSASYKFVTMKNYDFACSIKPKSGIVLETKFTFECSGNPFGTYFWAAIGIDRDKEQVLQYDSSWEYLSFVVPRLGVVSLHYTDYSGMEGFIEWDPNDVENFKLIEVERKTDTIKDLYTKGNESVQTLLQEGDYGSAMNKMSLISKSISHMNASEYDKVEGVAKTLVQDLITVPMKDSLQIEQASSIMGELTSVNVTFDTSFAEDIASYCQDLAEKYRIMVKNEYLVRKADAMPIHSTINHLMECTSAGNRPNFLAIEQKSVDIEMTTVQYIIEEGNINTETYEEYKDDHEVVLNQEAYKNTTRSFLKACTLNGRALLRRIMHTQMQNTDMVESKDCSVLVVRMAGYDLVQAPLKVHSVAITFSKDLVDSESIYSLIVCVTKQNLFWWQNMVDIVSDILTISVRIGKSDLTTYERPFEITFGMTRMPSFRYPSLQTSVRMRHLLRDSENPFEEQLSVYVIFLEAGYSMVVYFQDIEPGLSLNVISTTFKLPILNDFKENMQIITNRDNLFVNEEVYGYDTIRLLAVIPSPPNEHRKNETFNFKMDAFAVTCMKWKRGDGGHWAPGCKARLRNTKFVFCLCKTLSTITTTVKNIPMKEWQDYIPLPVYLEQQHFYGVCVVVLLMFFLYSVAICFTVIEEDHTLKAIYFLSDVVCHNKFGYLIIVETAFRIGSGTTSNVMIKLKGIRGESEPHVVNYPDPSMVLLQRHTTDWFLLATDSNLGRLTEIELWIDGVGSSPTWQCSSVAVFDLQHRKWYYFRISRSFTIYPKPRIYLKSYPFEEKKHRTSLVVLVNLFKKCLPSFRIFNLSLRQADEALSYIKRLTLILSILTSIALWCLILNGIPNRDPTDIIMKTCTFTITPSLFMHGVGGSIATAIYHIPIQYLFLTSKVQLPYHPISQKSKKPLIFTLFCWITVSLLIISNLTLIVFYGVWIPDVTTIGWTTEIIIGMFFYIFVVDVLYSSCDKILNGSREMERYVRKFLFIIFNDIEKQRLILYRVYGKYLLRPFLQHLYKPLQGVALKVLWHTEKIRFEVRELLENLTMFFIYIGLMYMLILANKDYRSVYSNSQIKNIVNGYTTRTFPLNKVISIKTLEHYLEKTLVEATNSHTWYRTYAVKDPGMTVDYSNKLIGVIRLRQHRAELDSCEIPDLMRFNNFTCVADYFQSHNEDTYGERWGPEPPRPLEGRMMKVWRFTPSNETGTSTYIGKLGIYGGGGYLAFLGRGMKNSLVNLKYLREFEWINRETRSIFIEFLLYNTNFNIFNAVRYTIEKSALGYLKKEVKVDTSKMLLRANESIIALPVLLGLFVVLVVVFSIRTIFRIKTTLIWYFRDLWHLVDIILIILSLVCVYMFYRRSSEVAALLKSLEGKEHNEFVNYFPLLEVDTAFTVTCAILITVATIKLWGMCRFIIIFRVVEQTFTKSFLPLCAVFLYNGIVILAFSMFGFLLFVDHSYRFEGFVNTLEFLIILNLRPFEGEELDMLVEPNLGLGYVFYVAYAIAVKLFSCVYTVLIIIYYSKAQEYYSNYEDVYSVWDHLKEQFRFYYNVWRMKLKSLRLSAGQNEQKRPSPVSPKADEVRYADSFILSVDKITTMSLISLCVIRNSNPNRKSLTQKDIRIMTYALLYLRKLKHEPELDEKVERFYKGKMGLNKVKLIHETVLKKVEVATSLLLGETIKDVNLRRDEVLMGENASQIARMKENLAIMLESVKKIHTSIVSSVEGTY